MALNIMERRLPDQLHDLDIGDDDENPLWTFVRCGAHRGCVGPVDGSMMHKDQIIIAVDGASVGQGTPNARASSSVFFHRNSLHNCSFLLDEDQTHTTKRAELNAALRALNIAISIRSLNDTPVGFPPGPYCELRRVVIKIPSYYLMKAMTEWIYTWEENGYAASQGVPVANRELFEQLQNAFAELNNRNVQVQFWRVPRVRNRVAQYLANAVLDGLSVQEAMGECCENNWC